MSETHYCPDCKGPLKEVTYPRDSMYNRDQWDSVRAGDYYCPVCPNNQRGKSGRCYWWDRETISCAVATAMETLHPTEEPVSKRASWDQYFLQIAQMVATRATCPRKSVGCVLVRDRMILSSGYNGSIRGMPHCTDVGCVMENDHCSSVIHAELNAIVQAARNGVRIEAAECYVTASPCWNCFKILANAGVKRIVYGEFYRDDRIFAAAEKLGIELVLV